MKQIGVNAYRFSIEWSRFEPEDEKWSGEVIRHYHMVKERENRDVQRDATYRNDILTLFFFSSVVFAFLLRAVHSLAFSPGHRRSQYCGNNSDGDSLSLYGAQMVSG